MDLDAKLTSLGSRAGCAVLGILWQSGQPFLVEAAEPESIGVAA